MHSVLRVLLSLEATNEKTHLKRNKNVIKKRRGAWCLYSEQKPIEIMACVRLLLENQDLDKTMN